MTKKCRSGDEKFGVIVCTDCRNSKAVDLTHKTSRCHRCGKKLILKKMKVYYRTNSREEASWAIGRLNAEMSGGELPEKEEERVEDPYVRASKEAGIADDERERLGIICRVLDESMGHFTLEDVKKVYSLLGREDPDDMEKKLRDLKEIYEPREGVFRVA